MMDKDDHAFNIYLARGSNLSQRYHAEATQQPSAALNSAILSAARRTPKYVPETVRRPWYKRWQVPISIAAVFFFGIGVTLRTVMQEAKLSQPAPAAQDSNYALPKTVPSTSPAAVEPNKGMALPPTDSAAPGVTMGGAISPAPLETKAKPQRLDNTELEKRVLPRDERHLAQPAPLPQRQPAAPVMEKDKAMGAIAPAPAAASRKPAGDDALENKSSGGSPSTALKKEMANGKKIDERALAPKAVPAPESAVSSDAVLSTPKRDQTPRQVEQAGQPASPPLTDLPAPKPRQDAPNSSDAAPHLPDGHHPVVDGKTFRAREPNSEPIAQERDAPMSAVVVEDQTEAPEVWLKRIQELRRAGKVEEADAQLKRLRARHPEFHIPNDL